MIKIKEPRDLEDRIMRGDDTETLRRQRKGFMSGKACPSRNIPETAEWNISGRAIEKW